MDAFKQAREYASQFARSLDGLSELEKAEAIYRKVKSLDYGLSGALERSVWLRLPHEVAEDNQANCHEQALMLYFLADAANLSPRFFRIFTDGTWHGSIDVEVSGKRVYMDPINNAFGEVVSYDDSHVVFKTDDISKGLSFSGISELKAEDVMRTTSELRNNCALMLADTQQPHHTIQTALGEGIERIRFDAETNSFYRIVAAATPGYLPGHVAVQQKQLSGSTLKPVKMSFVDATGFGWQSIDDQHPLGEINNGILTLSSVETMTEEQKEQIAISVLYRATLKGDYIFSEEEHVAFRKAMEDDFSRVYNTFTKRGKEQIDSFRKSLFEDPNWRKDVDWWMFSKKYRGSVICDESAVRQYFEQVHSQLLPAFEREDHAIVSAEAALARHISGLPSTQAPTQDDVLAKIGKLENLGLASVYRETAGMLRQVVLEGREVSQRLLELAPLFSTQRMFAETADIVSRYMESKGKPISLKDPIFSRCDAAYDMFNTTINHIREFSQEEGGWQDFVLVHDKFSAYDTSILINYETDAFGRFSGIQVFVSDSVSGSEEIYVHINKRVSSLDEITVEALQNEIVTHLPDILGKRNLSGLEPSQNDFFSKNHAAFLYWSVIGDSRQPLQVDEERLKTFESALWAETKWALNNPLISPSVRKGKEELISEWTRLQTDSPEEYRRTLCTNYMLDVLGRKQRMRTLMHLADRLDMEQGELDTEGQFTTDRIREAALKAYAHKIHYGIKFLRNKARSEEMSQLVAETESALMLTNAAYEDIRRQPEKLGTFAPSLLAINEFVEKKEYDAVGVVLEEIPSFSEIQNEDQVWYLHDALTSFELRLMKANAQQELVTHIKSLRELLETTTVPEQIDIEEMNLTREDIWQAVKQLPTV